MMDHPEMVAGLNRYDTDLILACHEKLVAKGGAEGLHCVGFTERGWGLAAKISDGARRAIYPFSVEIMRQLGVITAGELEKLKKYHTEKIYNWTDKEVGYIKPEFEIEKLRNSSSRT
jgi:L-asparaginase II